MDPTTCYRLMRDTESERDWFECLTYAATLLHWLRMGGFPPAGMERGDVMTVAKSTLERAYRGIGEDALTAAMTD
jgi:hypothetical protein